MQAPPIELQLVLIFHNQLLIFQNKVMTSYLPPAAEGRSREIIKRLLSVRSSRFCININISFISEDIFTKFAGNVYGYENLSLQNFGLILKNKMATIANCLKIIKLF